MKDPAGSVLDYKVAIELAELMSDVVKASGCSPMALKVFLTRKAGQRESLVASLGETLQSKVRGFERVMAFTKLPDIHPNRHFLGLS